MTDDTNLPPLLESLIQAAYDDGQHKREEFSEQLKAARASVVTYVQRLRTAPHPAITHCDNCGCDWLDNGLNPVGCPYCKQPTAVGEAVVERIAALLYEKATGEPWAVAGVKHPGPDRDYYRWLARKVAALAQQPAAVDERRKGMDKITKKTTTITETTRLELTEEQIASALLKHFGMVGGTVSFDVSSGGFLRGAQIELTRVNESTE